MSILDKQGLESFSLKSSSLLKWSCSADKIENDGCFDSKFDLLLKLFDVILSLSLLSIILTTNDVGWNLDVFVLTWSDLTIRLA